MYFFVFFVVIFLFKVYLEFFYIDSRGIVFFFNDIGIYVFSCDGY